MASTDYVLPVLPTGSAEYTIVRWLKRAGDAVTAGDPLLVVVNDRAELALPAASAGVLDRVYVAEGGAVAPGVRLAAIVEQTADMGDTLDVIQSSEAERDQAGRPTISDRQFPTSGVRISPVARRIATSRHVDITYLSGTGVSGRIVKADVLAALAEQSPQHRALSQGSSPIPSPLSPDIYVLTAIEVDLECVAIAIAQLRLSFARRRLELSYKACIALAALAALPSHPLLNSYWADSTIVIRRRVHLAVAASDAPTRIIFDAQDLNLRGLARALGHAAAQQQIGERTFTIADLGEHGWADLAAQARGAAILGIGAVRARPLVIDQGGERLAIRHAALLTLAYDARVLDQCQADAFLRDLKRRLEQFDV